MEGPSRDVIRNLDWWKRFPGMVHVQGTTGGYAVNLQTLSVAPAPTTAVAPATAVTVVTEPTEGTGGKKARTEPADVPRLPAAPVIDLTFDPEEAADAFITKYAGSYDDLLLRMNRVFGKGPNEPPGQRSQKLASVLRKNLIAYFTQNTEDPSVDDIPLMVRTNENEWPANAWRQVLSGPEEPQAPEAPEEEITPPSPFKLPALLTPAQKKWNDFEQRLAILGISLRDELLKLFPKLATVPDPPDLVGNIRAAFLRYYPMQTERPYGILEKIAEEVVGSEASRVKLIDLLRTLMSRVAAVRPGREGAVEPVTKKSRSAHAPTASRPLVLEIQLPDSSDIPVVQMGVNHWNPNEPIGFVSDMGGDGALTKILNERIPQTLGIEQNALRLVVPYAFSKAWMKGKSAVLPSLVSTYGHFQGPPSLNITILDGGEGIPFLPLEFMRHNQNWEEFSSDWVFDDMEVTATFELPEEDALEGRVDVIMLRSRASPAYRVAIAIHYPPPMEMVKKSRGSAPVPHLVGFYIYLLPSSVIGDK